MRNYLKGIELLQTKRKSAVVPIFGEPLSSLFGRVNEEDFKIIRRKLEEVEEDQRVWVQVARQSGSIRNVTRLE